MKKLILQLTALALAVVLSGSIACQPQSTGDGGGEKSPSMCG